MSGNYRLDVENFGPIVRAGVDLRPLTIFVGPSNTGKSYLAVLIYALHRLFGGSHPMFGARRGMWFVRRGIFHSRRSIGAPLRRSLREWLTAKPGTAPPDDVARFLLRELENPRELGENLGGELRRCFGVPDLQDLVRRPGRAAAAVDLRVSREGRPDSARYAFSFGSGTPRLSAQVNALPPFSHDDELHKYWRTSLEAGGRRDNGELKVAVNLVLDTLALELLHPLFRRACYLPADRTGVMHSHQVVVSTLIQSATTAGLRPATSDIPMLSGVLADFLDGLIHISQRPRRGADEQLAATVENEILAGAVRTERNESGYPTFSYRPRGWSEDLPLMRASSMVSELAPVVLYLRHVVRPGDVLIIEEPEAHLHPGMQAAFARALARLVRSGLRVVMTTHSEWVLEQIGNLVRLSDLPEKRRGKLADAALDPADVGAWLFRPSGRPRGSVVEEVVLDPETGLYRTDYADVSDALYNEGAAIFNGLQETGAR